MIDNMLRALTYLSESVRVKRCHAEPVLHVPSVGEHTCGVALLCLLLTEGKASRDLLVSALCHDLGERRWGDMPGNVKRELKLDDRFEQLERYTLRELGLEFDAKVLLSETEARTLRLADKLDLMLYCCVERAQGNQLIRYIWNNCVSAVHDVAGKSELERHVIVAVKQLWRQYDQSN